MRIIDWLRIKGLVGSGSATEFLNGLGLFATPAGGSGDLLSTLSAAPIPISGAATATISRMHYCTGGSPYTLGLPAVAGNDKKHIGVVVKPGMTNFVTLDGNGTQTLGGALTRVVWKNEAVLLECDESAGDWIKVAGDTIPMVARMGLSADQSIPDVTVTKVTLDRSDVDNTGLMVSTGSSQITIGRTSTYKLFGKSVWDAIAAGTANRFLVVIYKTNTSGVQLASGEQQSAGTGFNGAPMAFDTVNLTAGDVVLLAVYQSTGGNRNVYGAAGNGGCGLSVIEVPSW
jgi:hypothetical protein